MALRYRNFLLHNPSPRLHSQMPALEAGQRGGVGILICRRVLQFGNDDISLKTMDGLFPRHFFKLCWQMQYMTGITALCTDTLPDIFC